MYITLINCKSSSQILSFKDRDIPIYDEFSEILNFVGETTEPQWGLVNLEEHSYMELIKNRLIKKIENEQCRYIDQYQEICDLPVEKNGSLLLKKEGTNDYHSANFTIHEIRNELCYISDGCESSRCQDKSFNLDEICIYLTPRDKILQVWILDPNKHKRTSFFLKSSEEQNIDDWFFAIYFAKCNRLKRLIDIQNLNPYLNKAIFSTFSHEYVKQGFLWKSRPNSHGRDNFRWIVLHINSISYYKTPFDLQPKNEICILGRRKQITVEIKVSSQFDEYHCFNLKTAERTYVFSSQSKDDRDSWVKSIEQCLDPKLLDS